MERKRTIPTMNELMGSVEIINGFLSATDKDRLLVSLETMQELVHSDWIELTILFDKNHTPPINMATVQIGRTAGPAEQKNAGECPLTRMWACTDPPNTWTDYFVDACASIDSTLQNGGKCSLRYCAKKEGYLLTYHDMKSPDRITVLLVGWLGTPANMRVLEMLQHILPSIHHSSWPLLNVPLTKDITATLTSRELQVLSLASKGMKSYQIGNRLKCTERTVRFHLGNIYQKLGVTNRVDAVLKAVATDPVINQRLAHRASVGGIIFGNPLPNDRMAFRVNTHLFRKHGEGR